MTDVSPSHPPTSEVLDALADLVATALDAGDEDRAWALTRTLEAMSGTGGGADRPPSPVIGRRFAVAHRRLLARASGAHGPSTGPSGGRRGREVVAQAQGAPYLPDAHPAG